MTTTAADTSLAELIKAKCPGAVTGAGEFRGETTLTTTPENLHRLLSTLKTDPDLGFNYLADIAGADYPGRSRRFEVNYQVSSIPANRSVRVKVSVGEDEPLPTATDVWKTANWHEREIFDLFGVRFSGHPDLRRILCPDFWTGHPLRKDFPLDGEEVAFTHNQASIVPQEAVWKKGLGKAEYALEQSPADVGEDTTMVINMGPQHPSTHGVLRLVLQVDGETVLRTIPHIGYLHTGIEKTAENLTWQQAVVVTDRMDYLSPPTNNLAYALAVEKLMGIEVPERAQDIRVLIAELTRLASHLIALGTHAMELGAMSVFFYCWRDRELILDIMDFLSGVRMMTSFINIGGVRADLPDGFHKKVQDFLDVFPARVDEYDGLLTNNRIWEKRTLGISVITPEEALDYGLSGPNIRGSGIKWDLRKDRPYLTYPKYSFDVPVGKTGDVYDRYLVRIEEMRQSREICVQALKNISPRGEFRTADRKISPPPKEELERNMEALIHHFLLYTRGFEPPEGEVYSTIESARGELGIYLVSDGSNKPYRMHVRAPSFVSLQILPAICEGGLLADVIAAIGSLDPVMGEVDR